MKMGNITVSYIDSHKLSSFPI